MNILAFLISSKSHDKVMRSLGQLLSSTRVQLYDLTVRAFNDSYQISGVVSAPWNNLAKFEVKLQLASQTQDWTVQSWRPHRTDKPIGLPYSLEATFIEDDSKTISELLAMFAEMKIFVDSIDYQITPLDNQKHNIARVQLKLRLPLTVNVQFLREKFYGLS